MEQELYLTKSEIEEILNLDFMTYTDYVRNMDINRKKLVDLIYNIEEDRRFYKVRLEERERNGLE